MEGLTRAWPIEGPLDLGRTVRALATWGAATWIRVDPSGAWYADRTEDGPASMRLTRRGGELTAEAWGPGSEQLLERAPRVAGLHDHPIEVPEGHPVVMEALKRSRGVRLGATDRVFPTLVSVVLAQKVTGKESKAQLKRMAWEWGETAPGPRSDLRLLPTPRDLARRAGAEFHLLGVERRRAAVVLEVARRATRLEQCVGMEHEAAAARMQVLPGIGPWTAGVVCMEALGHPDAVPVGDYHLPNYVAWNLAGEPRADDARMLELLEPYRGQRGRVVRVLKTVGSAPPKWGPRGDARDIRGM